MEECSSMYDDLFSVVVVFDALRIDNTDVGMRKSRLTSLVV